MAARHAAAPGLSCLPALRPAIDAGSRWHGGGFLAGHTPEADEGAGMLDLAHVPQPVLVDPALDRVEAGEASLTGHAGAEGRGDLRREGPAHDDLPEQVRLQPVEPGLRLAVDESLVLEERCVVTDALSHHLGHAAVLAVVGDAEVQALEP